MPGSHARSRSSSGRSSSGRPSSGRSSSGRSSSHARGGPSSGGPSSGRLSSMQPPPRSNPLIRNQSRETHWHENSSVPREDGPKFTLLLASRGADEATRRAAREAALCTPELRAAGACIRAHRVRPADLYNPGVVSALKGRQVTGFPALIASGVGSSSTYIGAASIVAELQRLQEMLRPDNNSCPKGAKTCPRAAQAARRLDNDERNFDDGDGNSDESGFGNESGFGDESGFGAESGFGNESGFGDESGFGAESGFGDESEFGDESGLGDDSRALLEKFGFDE